MTDDNVHRIWTEDELDDALAAFGSEVHTDERAIARARAALMAETAHIEDGGTRLTNIEKAPRRSGKRWMGAAAAVGVLVAGGLIAQTVSFGGNPAPASAEAVAALDNAATKTIGAQDDPVGPGQYRYVSTHAWWMDHTALNGGKPFARLAENLLETWVPAKETDEWLERRDVTGKSKWVVGTEEGAKAAGVKTEDGWPEGEWRAPCGDWFAKQQGEQPCTRPGGWQNPTPEWQAGLPADPDALYQRLRQDAPQNKRGDTELLVSAADALRSGLITKDVRANLYKALAKIPGLQVTDEQANLDGRVGTALGMDDGTIREEIIVDPQTGQFIGERHVMTKDADGLKAGTVLEFTSVTTKVVDGIGVKPAS